MEQQAQKRNSVKSSRFSIKGKTFFFDVNVATNDKKYLKITESRYMGEGNDSVRNSVVIFPEHLQDFERSLKEIVGYLN
ncbi:MAG TPA: DUF3276 family protein [Candidatus Saccharimonadales bacterium]|nr:DUF3276 family protein [Candidatus Saccharimonadales bacterium]